MSTTQERILSQLSVTSNAIAEEFDRKYGSEIEDLAKEFAKSFDLLTSVINRDDQSSVSDQDFLSASIFWTGLNTILAGVDLFRRGYNKEPQMLLRNALEIFAAAYDIHKNIESHNILTEDPESFDSTKSIKYAREIHPIIGNFYGILSDKFAHVSTMHMVPHNSSTPLAFGGLHDPANQETVVLGLTTFTLTFDVLNSILEIALIKYVEHPNFWKLVGEDTYEFAPNSERISVLMEKIKHAAESIRA